MASDELASSSAPLVLDTSPTVEAMQLDAWRALSPEAKAALVRGMTQAVFAMARAGIRDRHPHASLDEQRLRLAVLLHGGELATRAFPEAAWLAPE